MSRKRFGVIIALICILLGMFYLGYRCGYIPTEKEETFEVQLSAVKCELNGEKKDYYRSYFEKASSNDLKLRADIMHITKDQLKELAQHMDQYSVYTCTVTLTNHSTKRIKGGRFEVVGYDDTFINADSFMEPAILLYPDDGSKFNAATGQMEIFIPTWRILQTDPIYLRYSAPTEYGSLRCSATSILLLEDTRK